MTSRYRPPEILAEHHDTSAFTCRSTEQTDWLRRHARQPARSGTTKIFVVTYDDAGPVVACRHADDGVSVSLGLTPSAHSMWAGSGSVCEGRVAAKSIFSVLHADGGSLFGDTLLADLFSTRG